MLMVSCSSGYTSNYAQKSPDTVYYKGTGTARAVNITLSNAQGGTEQYSNIAVPFSFAYNNFPSNFMYLSAQNQGESGSITVESYLNGNLIKRSSSSGAYVISTASAAK